MSKIGVFSGTFDPVHKGHITFALESIRQAGLSEVYFLPEQVPRKKTGVTHYAHRIAMLKLALKPYQNLHVLELPDRQFNLAKSLPRLEKLLGSDLQLLMGSDAFSYLAEAGENAWPNVGVLYEKCGLVVGLRANQSEEDMLELVGLLPENARVQLVQAGNHFAASSDIRSALMRGKAHKGHLTSLTGYIKANWLYAVVSPNNS